MGFFCLGENIFLCYIQLTGCVLYNYVRIFTFGDLVACLPSIFGNTLTHLLLLVNAAPVVVSSVLGGGGGGGGASDLIIGGSRAREV